MAGWGFVNWRFVQNLLLENKQFLLSYIRNDDRIWPAGENGSLTTKASYGDKIKLSDFCKFML